MTVGIPEKICPVSTPSHALAAAATIRELPAGFRSHFQNRHSPSAVGYARIRPYIGENTRRRGHSLAGYQLLWKAPPIARSEETTVTAK